jgi:hypothetical protein
MRTPNSITTSPWGNPDIDNGWNEMVVSSAPPPPPREAIEKTAKPKMLPADFHTWQEHGSRAASVERAVEEPSFTAGDRRLWVAAGTLMALATVVLALLGVLTFGASSSSDLAAASAHPAAVEPAHATAPSRAVEPTRAGATVAAPAKVSNPRHLSAKATKHGRPHKRALTAER